MKLGKKFQMGGPMPEGAGAPVLLDSQDPTAVLLNTALQALLNLDCLMAMQVCQMLVEALGLQGGPQEGAPTEEAPQSQPVYRMGGRLLRRIKN